jgi:hypothetical protein
VIISVLIILYASGYQIDYRHLFTPLGVQKTGMTIIYSNPAGADIYLNDKEVKRFSSPWIGQIIPAQDILIKTPANIKDLTPGQYDLRVEIPGYWPWERLINIFPGKITHVLDINLFRKTAPELLAQIDSQPIFLSPNDKKIFLSAADRFFDLKTQTLGNVLSTAVSSTTGVSWSADSNRLAAGNSLLNLKNPEKNLALNKIIGQGLTNLKWNADLDKIYYQYKNSVNVFNFSDQTSQTIITANNILDYEVSNKTLYYLVRDGINAKLEFYSLDGKKIVKEISLPASDGYRLINPDAKLINVYDQKYQTLYLIDPVISDTNPIQETIDSVKKTQWISDSELVWANDYEIWALDLDKNENKLITRWSQPITAIIKTKAANYILYTTDKTINVITWTASDDIQTTELANFDSVSSPVYNDTEKNLYFIASSGGEDGLYRLNIQ